MNRSVARAVWAVIVPSLLGVGAVACDTTAGNGNPGSPTPAGGEAGGSAGSDEGRPNPGAILDLANWKLDLPLDAQGHVATNNPAPNEHVTQPELDTFEAVPWFRSVALNVATHEYAVAFSANAGGAKTSSNTKFGRSELREMTSTGGLASWRFGDGKTHTMVVEEAITQLMTERPRAGAGQIHDAKNDVFLLVAVGNHPGGKSTTADVIAQFDNSQTKRPIIENSGYTLGDFFTLTVAVTPTGTVLVSIDYKGTTYSVSESSFPNIQSDNESLNGMYFKAGLYPQSNVNDYHEQPMDMAELVMKRVSVSHQ